MLQNLFRNIPDVTKNLLILNVLFFLAKFLLEAQGIDAGELLGLHYPSSQYFEPFQIITHFFMHGNFMHILFNMFGLVFIGSHLERHWGKKRFATFYIITAIGASVLHLGIQAMEIYQLTGEIFPNIEIQNLTYVGNGQVTWNAFPLNPGYSDASHYYVISTVGASGAIYGLLMAFAMLFPNTEFMLLFPPIPIKAKWMAIILGAFALYQGFQNSPGDSVAHFAHLGGMLFGFILIKIWQLDRNNFY